MGIDIIYADVHERVEKLARYFSEYTSMPDVDSFTVTGDFFDKWKGEDRLTYEMARWLRETADHPKLRKVWGNHDIHYAYPKVEGLKCGGWTLHKSYEIPRFVTQPIWDTFEYHAWVQGWLITHAGLTEQFLHPFLGFSEEWLMTLAMQTKHDLEMGRLNGYVAAGDDRCGGFPRGIIGGITWVDWSTFKPIPGLNQIVGHSWANKVRQKNTLDSKNICFDTNNQHLIVLENGVPEIKRI